MERRFFLRYFVSKSTSLASVSYIDDFVWDIKSIVLLILTASCLSTFLAIYLMIFQLHRSAEKNSKNCLKSDKYNPFFSITTGFVTKLKLFFQIYNILSYFIHKSDSKHFQYNFISFQVLSRDYLVFYCC